LGFCCVRELPWTIFHNIEDKANGLLGESRDQIIILRLLPVDPVKVEMVLSQHEPANRVIHPESWKPKTVEAIRPRLIEVDEILVFHLRRGAAVRKTNKGSPL
jgi:hypothetical protein